jgi:hypothetical protein
MKIRLTNAEILNLFSALDSIDTRGNAKFTYTLSKNRAILKHNVEALQEAGNSYSKDNARFTEYQSKAEELVKRYAVNKDGTPSMRTGADGQTMQRVIPAEKMGEFAKAREELDDNYKDVILGIQAHQAGFAQLLKEETEVDLRLLPIKDIPDGGISTQVMNLIFVFVEDDKPETPLKLVH